MLFVLVAVGLGAALGLILGRVLAPTAPSADPVIEPEEPNRLTNHQLEELLAPYEHAA